MEINEIFPQHWHIFSIVSNSLRFYISALDEWPAARIGFSVSMAECSYKYRDFGKCLTECENGKYHKVSVVLQQMGSMKCDDKSDLLFLSVSRHPLP